MAFFGADATAERFDSLAERRSALIPGPGTNLVPSTLARELGPRYQKPLVEEKFVRRDGKIVHFCARSLWVAQSSQAPVPLYVVNVAPTRRRLVRRVHLKGGENRSSRRCISREHDRHGGHDSPGPCYYPNDADFGPPQAWVAPSKLKRPASGGSGAGPRRDANPPRNGPARRPEDLTPYRPTTAPRAIWTSGVLTGTGLTGWGDFAPGGAGPAWLPQDSIHTAMAATHRAAGGVASLRSVEGRFFDKRYDGDSRFLHTRRGVGVPGPGYYRLTRPSFNRGTTFRLIGSGGRGGFSPAADTCKGRPAAQLGRRGLQGIPGPGAGAYDVSLSMVRRAANRKEFRPVLVPRRPATVPTRSSSGASGRRPAAAAAAAAARPATADAGNGYCCGAGTGDIYDDGGNSGNSANAVSAEEENKATATAMAPPDKAAVLTIKGEPETPPPRQKRRCMTARGRPRPSADTPPSGAPICGGANFLKKLAELRADMRELLYQRTIQSSCGYSGSAGDGFGGSGAGDGGDSGFDTAGRSQEEVGARRWQPHSTVAAGLGVPPEKSAAALPNSVPTAPGHPVGISWIAELAAATGSVPPRQTSQVTLLPPLSQPSPALQCVEGSGDRNGVAGKSPSGPDWVVALHRRFSLSGGPPDAAE